MTAEGGSTASSVSTETKANKRTTAYVVKSFVAGGIAGCSFLGVFRAIRDIHSVYGVPGLFQGHSATLLRIFPYAAIKFMTYEQYKTLIMPRKEDETPMRRLVAGSMAGVSSLFASYPLDLLRTRLAYEIRMPKAGTDGEMKSPGLVETGRMIYHEPNPYSRHGKFIGGVMNFYRGFVPTTYGMIPYAGVSFMCYEGMKAWAVERDGWWTYESTRRKGTLDEEGKSRQLTWWAQLTVGGLSGLIAQTASYPFEVIRRHMQIAGKIENGAGNGGVKKFPTTWETTKTIYAKKGPRGFFVGLSIGFMKVVPMHAVSFYVYEYMKVLLDF
ncbi:mitochondrial carrier [Rhizoclosmatium globosum]|uniref:Mitochondrial carrier n=1 Tax=Rhizoclosmatium globosum TaxID=329046 RepID=A0A1Y2BUV1_9FUNG|nr:hypothetical protein HDU79_009522 [Rhizoclosmatium sp. JEL0117]ORY38540.1 mitochondrial carrier [Rhizoclosmatium globosum]|eukprot:ORY38540.1 mitochondrial carrier [Rhizoclosmatium globosum]